MPSSYSFTVSKTVGFCVGGYKRGRWLPSPFVFVPVGNTWPPALSPSVEEAEGLTFYHHSDMVSKGNKCWSEP